MDSVSYFEIGGQIVECINTSIPSRLPSAVADRRERLRGAPAKPTESMQGGRQAEQTIPYTSYSGIGMPISWLATQVLLKIASSYDDPYLDRYGNPRFD